VNQPTGRPNRSAQVLLFSAGVAGLLAVWTVIARVVDSTIIVPSPLETIRSLFAEVTDPAYYRRIGATALRACGGFGISLVIGSVWGAAAGIAPSLDRFLKPALVLIRATPVIAVILLALIWFDQSIAPLVVTLLMVLPVIAENVRAGVHQTSADLTEMAGSYCVPRGTQISEIILPGLRPFLVASARSGLGMAYKVTVAAEVIMQPPWGLGSTMQEARFYLDTPRIIALTITVVVLSGLTELGLRLVHGSSRRLRDAGRASNARIRAVAPSLLRKPVGGESGMRHLENQPRPLVVDSVTKRFGTNPVVDRVTLTAPPGRITVLLGPSGCGKTTLLRIIAGFEQADSGTTDRADTVSFVFQEPRLIPWRTVVENCALVLPERGNPSPAIDQWLERVMLSGSGSAYPHQLSGGMQQRASLARAFVFGGELFLMDEPFQNLDAGIRLELWGLSRRVLRESGRKALFVTHDLTEAVCMADTITILTGAPGRVAGTIEVSLDESARDPREPEVQRYVARLFELLLTPVSGG
jgi:NitT/TauT family transport system ATP-binding protein